MKTTRREFLQRGTMGLSAIGLSSSLLSPVFADTGKPDAAALRPFLEASRNEHNPHYQWHLTTQEKFEHAEDMQRFQPLSGHWEIAGGQLKAVDGLGGIILVAPVPGGPQRIEFDATLLSRPDGRICNIGVILNAVPAKGAGSYAEGYALITAQYFNQATEFYRKKIPLARTEWSPIVPGQKHHIVAEWTPPEGHLRFFVDERIVLDAWDRAQPLSPDPSKWIGLWAYETDMIVKNLTISTGTRLPRRKPAKRK